MWSCLIEVQNKTLNKDLILIMMNQNAINLIQHSFCNISDKIVSRTVAPRDLLKPWSLKENKSTVSYCLTGLAEACVIQKTELWFFFRYQIKLNTVILRCGPTIAQWTVGPSVPARPLAWCTAASSLFALKMFSLNTPLLWVGISNNIKTRIKVDGYSTCWDRLLK